MPCDEEEKDEEVWLDIVTLLIVLVIGVSFAVILASGLVTIVSILLGHG